MILKIVKLKDNNGFIVDLVLNIQENNDIYTRDNILEFFVIKRYHILYSLINDIV